MILVLVPVIFELLFLSTLALFLVKAEDEFENLRNVKEQILRMHRGEWIVARGLLSVSRGRKTPLNEHQKDITTFTKFLNEPPIDHKKIRGFPELLTVAKLYEEGRASLKSMTREARAIVFNESLSEEERLRQFDSYIKRNKPAFMEVLLESQPLTTQVNEIEKRTNEEERENVAQFRIFLAVFVIFGLGASLLLSLFLAQLFLKDVLRRLEHIASNASLIASWKPLPPVQHGDDEIAQLDRVLHTTSGVLEYARLKELAILDNAASVICSLDERLKFVDVNVTATRFWNYEPEDLLGLSLLSIIHADTVSDTREKFEEIARGEGRGEIENLLRRKDKSYLNCLWKIAWSPEKQLYYCVIHDVTEQRAAERLKQHIISIVSHDLRAPLTAIGINFDILLSGKLSEEIPSVTTEIQRAESNRSRLMELVKDLLELEKFGVGKSTLEKTCVSAAYICDESKEALGGLATQANVTIRGPSGDAAVDGDETKLIQVMNNLLSNAIKYSPPHSVVTLAVTTDGAMVKVSVSDQGPGIPLEEQSLIFDKFHQSRSGANSDQRSSINNWKSTGLGLAIVDAIVTAHGGECGVKSAAGSGSTFWITIPEFIDPEEAPSHA